ncbi:MAG TPA: hypothetical protein GX705_08405 [Clostridiales bacterium]|nr:hypothetical protein [Clostridiaceae bacterium]HHX56353.1 hypothetical protein [Clostridiales bacterium]
MLCLGVVTAIIGVHLIIAGLKLTGAVDSLKEFSYTNNVNRLMVIFSVIVLPSLSIIHKP